MVSIFREIPLYVTTCTLEIFTYVSVWIKF